MTLFVCPAYPQVGTHEKVFVGFFFHTHDAFNLRNNTYRSNNDECAAVTFLMLSSVSVVATINPIRLDVATIDQLCVATSRLDSDANKTAAISAA